MVQALLTFILGPWGVSFAALATAGTALAAGAHMVPGRAIIMTFACCAAAWVVAYIVQTYVGVGGIGL